MFSQIIAGVSLDPRAAGKFGELQQRIERSRSLLRIALIASGLLLLLLTIIARNPPQQSVYTEPARAIIDSDLTPHLAARLDIVDRKPWYGPGDDITFMLSVRNTTENSAATNALVDLELDAQYFTLTGTPSDTQQSLHGFHREAYDELQHTDTYITALVPATVKHHVDSGTRICATVRATADNAAATPQEETCVGFINPCGDQTARSPHCVYPKVVCSIDAAVDTSTNTITLTSTATSTNQVRTTVNGYTYTDNEGTEQTFDADSYMHVLPVDYRPGATSPYTLTVSYLSGDGPGERTAMCQTPYSTGLDIENDDSYGLAVSSTPTEDTSGIQYVVTLLNTSGVDLPAKQYNIDARDLREYTDTPANTPYIQHTDTDIIIESEALSAHSLTTETFTAVLKDPTPSTNRPSPASTSYDCTIDITYGNTTSNAVDCPLIKTLERTPIVQSSATLFVSGAIFTVSLGLYGYTHLLLRELAIIRKEYQ